MANKRAQNFTWLLYPESAAKDYMETLKDYHVAMYLSLHNKDVNVDKDTGVITPEKDHIHVFTMFDGLKALDVLDELIAEVHGVKPPLQKYIVQSKRGMARYLEHMDDPDKYPYYLDPNHKVISICGAEDYYELCKGADETKRGERNATKDIQDYCRKHKIRNVATFLHLCNRTDHDEWMDVIQKYPYYWGMWFNAFRNEAHEELEEVNKIIARAKGEENDESDNRRDGDQGEGNQDERER